MCTVTAGGYEVTFSELIAAAGDYRARAEAIGQALARFSAATGLPDSAFGNLSGSGSMASQYREFRSQVTQDATKAADSLLTGAAALAETAIRYRVADQVVMAYLHNLSQSQSGQRTQTTEPEPGR